MVSVLDSGANGPGSGTRREHCVVFLGTLLPRCLSPPRCINGYRRNAGGNPAMDWHPIQGGVEILLVASCHGNRDKLRPDGPLGSYADFFFTFHPQNHAVKSIILNNFNLLQNDPETGRIFSQPPLISSERDKNVGNFSVRSALKTNEQPGTFKCARSRCKTCLFIVNTNKISGLKRSVKITDRFTCTSANVISTLARQVDD